MRFGNFLFPAAMDPKLEMPDHESNLEVVHDVVMQYAARSESAFGQEFNVRTINNHTSARVNGE